MNISKVISKELEVKNEQVEAAIKLLDEGCTVPFISRYRKEVTGGLNDEQLRTLNERLLYLRELEERKKTVLESIKEQGKLTKELKKQIDEFRRRNFQLQNETDSDRLFDEIDRFEREYEEFRQNPLVSSFLAAELAFCRQYQEIQEVISEAFALDFDLS